MPGPIVYMDQSEIREGKLEEVKSRIGRLTSFIREREPQLLLYGFYLSEDGRRMTVLAIHPDSESLELHMEVGGPAFREFADLIVLRTIEVYGSIGARAMERLREKAEYLGGASLLVAELEEGFSRLARTEAGVERA